MEVVGIVSEVIDKSKAPFKKALVVLDVTLINGTVNESENKKFVLEFRKHMADVAKALRFGDEIKANCYSDFKQDKHSNCYNNIVAQKAERV